MKAAKQISVALENKRGKLEDFCSTLAGKKVNILAMSVSNSAEQAIVRLVVDKFDIAKALLERFTLTWSVQDVVVTQLPNKSGAMASLAAKLAAAGVNIKYLYGGATTKGDKSVVVMGVSSVKKALKA